MSALSKLRSWWKAVTHRSELESQLDTELSFHIQAYAEDLMRIGVMREDAFRRARMELGGIVSQKENVRQSLQIRAWDDLIADISYGFRQLRRAPAFTVTVLLVLALGIGANAAMFSIVDATLLRWLPYRRPNQLVSVYLADAKAGSSWAFYQDIVEWQKASRGIGSLAYYANVEGYLQTSSGGEEFPAYQVSANLFSVLGVQPARGRAFLVNEQVPGRSNVVILSDAVWRTMLQAEPDVIGKQVTLN